MLFADIHTTPTGMALVGVSIALGIVAVIALSFILDKIRRRRAHAAEAADALKKIGLVKIPAALDAYSQGNIPEFLHDLRSLAKETLQPKQIVHEFEDVSWHVLTALLKDPESRAATFDKFNKLVTSTEQKPVVLPTAAAVVAAVAAPVAAAA